MASSLRAPWWKWALFSLGVTVAEVVLITAVFIWLLFLGVNPEEYLYNPNPAMITNGAVGGAFALLLAAQALGPMLMIPVFGPARTAVATYWKSPRTGVARRILLGAVVAAAVQGVWSLVAAPLEAGWTAAAPNLAEQMRMVDHLIYAVARGGRFWPAFWVFSVIVLLMPVAEELLFRGGAFAMLRRRWRFVPAAAATAIVFGLGHGPVNALPTALLGFWFAWQVEQDDSLAGAIALHALNNLGAVLVMVYGGA